MSDSSPRPVLRIANASGFYGDRTSAVREQVEGGEIDVLTGDYLAEITMMILAGDRARDPSRGFARSFVRQMEEVLAQCLERGIKVVANAGGLNPRACRDALIQVAEAQGLSPRVAIVHGDDLAPRLTELGDAVRNLETRRPLSELRESVLSANAYLGGQGIASALARGADIVITGRVTDSALTVGPAAWHFGWAADDWDRLAGAVAAGHVLECGTQATGGNYAFFDEIDAPSDIGFPIAEMHEDGSFVVTKHPGTGGRVLVDTVIAQLVYEIDAPAYLTPDVTAHFDSLALREQGRDRVLVSSARGTPPPPTLKVSVQHRAGFRNHVDLITGGHHAESKARSFESLFWERAGGRERFQETRVHRFEDAQGHLLVRLAARDPEEAKVGRRFSAAAFDLALAGPPGVTFGGPPTGATPCGATWPGAIDRARVPTLVDLDGDCEEIEQVELPATPGSGPAIPWSPDAAPPATLAGSEVEVELGQLCGARSGDKGAHANVGLWVRSPLLFGWLRELATVERLRSWLPESFDGAIERYELPKLGALNFLLRGYLGDGGTASLRLDSQAKLLGEHIRANRVRVDRALLDLAGPEQR